MSELTQQRVASLNVLHTLWQGLDDSPLREVVRKPLPIEIHNGIDRRKWYQGLELNQLHQACAIQRHLTQFSHQGDVLFPEEYISEVKWREQRLLSSRTKYRGVDVGDDDDDFEQPGGGSRITTDLDEGLRSAMVHHQQFDCGVGDRLSATHADQEDVLYDEAGRMMQPPEGSHRPDRHDVPYNPTSSQFDPYSGCMSANPVSPTLPSPLLGGEPRAYQSDEGGSYPEESRPPDLS